MQPHIPGRKPEPQVEVNRYHATRCPELGHIPVFAGFGAYSKVGRNLPLRLSRYPNLPNSLLVELVRSSCN
jgi:hypothetical protein